MPLDLAKIAADLRNELEALFGARFRDLLLYDSYARGDHREGSDMDVLALLDGREITPREISRIATVSAPLALAHDILLSVQPVSHEAYQKGDSVFLRAVRQDAVRAARAPATESLRIGTRCCSIRMLSCKPGRLTCTARKPRGSRGCCAVQSGSWSVQQGS